VFCFGYSQERKGYHCLDLASNRIIILRHVLFDESFFPFVGIFNPPSSSFDFLQNSIARRCPLALTLLQVPLILLPLMVLRLRLLPAVPGSSPHLASMLTTSSLSWSCQEPLLLLGPVLLLNAHHRAWGAPLDTSMPTSLVGSVPRQAPSSPVASTPRQAHNSSANNAHGMPPKMVPIAGPLPPKMVPIAPVDNAHGMRTRGKSGFWLPITKLNLQATALSPLPKTYRGALADLNWQDAMIEEFTTLQANNTWDLVTQPYDGDIVTGKWGFRHKFHPDGSHDWYKA
jgi:hypothetical protein